MCYINVFDILKFTCIQLSSKYWRVNREHFEFPNTSTDQGYLPQKLFIYYISYITLFCALLYQIISKNFIQSKSVGI